MDSVERDTRNEDGFNERGEKLFDAGEQDERNNFRDERIKRRRDKDKVEDDPSDDEADHADRGQLAVSSAAAVMHD